LNIVLIGYRCSGKTVTGRELAARLGRPHVDTDDWVVREAGAPVDCIVRKGGWRRFRDLESRVIRAVARMDGLVVSTGGGAVVSSENVRRLRAGGWLVWLKAGESVLRLRMKRDVEKGGQRPGIEGQDPFEEMAALLRKRTPLYEKAGDFHLDTGGLSPSEAAARILRSMPG
jgi:shikimate kinase